MNDNIKKAIVVLGGGILLYWLVKDYSLLGKGKNKDAKKEEAPQIDPKELKNKRKANAFVAVKAYVDAVNARESEKALDELNREFAKELKVRVYRRSKDGVIVATDLQGNIILENK
jgi:hypothetical protein